MSVLQKPEYKEVVLADGNTYKLSPLNLNVLADLEEELGVGLDKLADLMTSKPTSSLRLLLYILLKENYPDLNKRKVGTLVTLETMAQVSGIVSEILAVKV